MIVPLSEDTFSGDMSTVVEGFSGMGGSLHVSTSVSIDDIDIETDEDGEIVTNIVDADADGSVTTGESGFTMAEVILFTSYEDGLAFVQDEMMNEVDVEFETEETEDGFTFSAVQEDPQGTASITGNLSPEGLLVVETNIVYN